MEVRKFLPLHSRRIPGLHFCPVLSLDRPYGRHLELIEMSKPHLRKHVIEGEGLVKLSVTPKKPIKTMF